MMNNDIEKVLMTEEEIKACVAQLGKKIAADYTDEPLTLVCILKGASVFFADVMRAIDLPLQIDFMSVSSYGNDTKSKGVVQILKDLSTDVTGRNILLVEDIVDSGNTLAYLKEYLSNRGAKTVEICAFLDKPSRREKAVEVKYVGMTMPDEFLVGYGLDYAEDYRNLPYVGVLKRSVYEK